MITSGSVLLLASDSIVLNLDITGVMNENRPATGALHAFLQRLPDGEMVEMQLANPNLAEATTRVIKTWRLEGVSEGLHRFTIRDKPTLMGKLEFHVGTINIVKGADINLKVHLESNRVKVLPRLDGLPLSSVTNTDELSYDLKLERFGPDGKIEQTQIMPLGKQTAQKALGCSYFFVASGQHRLTLYETPDSRNGKIRSWTTLVEWQNVPKLEYWADFKSDNP